MHVNAEARFAADPQTVARMLADEEYVRAKVIASGALSHTASVVGDPESGFTVTTRRAMPTDSIPAHLRSMVGASLEVRQVEAWEPAGPDGRHGTVLVEVTGAPVRLTGTLRLLADGAGTRAVADGELRASIPLFGGAVEQAVAQAVRETLAAEERTAAQWLARD